MQLLIKNTFFNIYSFESNECYLLPRLYKVEICKHTQRKHVLYKHKAQSIFVVVLIYLQVSREGLFGFWAREPGVILNLLSHTGNGELQFPEGKHVTSWAPIRAFPLTQLKSSRVVILVLFVLTVKPTRCGTGGQ